MRELYITENEAGQRLDKLLKKYLNTAPDSFLHKMLRKKNITCNGKKAAGSDKLKQGDVIRLFLSEETIDRFMDKRPDALQGGQTSMPEPDIIYEDRHILLVNKPAGLLTQKAKAEDLSLNELVIRYLLQSGSLSAESLATFRPSVCNRLDRNTSGLVICGKTLPGLQLMSAALRDRSLHKYYLCLVAGEVWGERYIDGYLLKDERSNQVRIFQKDSSKVPKDAKPIETKYRSLNVCGSGAQKRSLLEVALLTGRTHQIRAHLASEGHPIIGDSKYGDQRINDHYRQSCRIKRQLLHAWRIEMPEMTGEFAYLSKKTFTADLPKEFTSLMPKELFLPQP